MARRLYTLIITLALPLIVLRLLWRSMREPGYRRNFMQRFGWSLTPMPSSNTPAKQGPIWVHAVSAGETRAAVPLIQTLRQHYPHIPIVLTHMTATGADTAMQLLGDQVICCVAPYDIPWAWRRFLGHYKPSICILIETEVWPNLIHACDQSGVPVVLASARLNERSLQRALRLSKLARPAFGAIAQVLAQTQADAQRLAQVGAHNLHVCGNIKFDLMIPQTQLELAQQWRAQLPHKHVICLASTREGEEQQFLDALALSTLPDNTLLLIVPRHPQRFDEVGNLLRNRSLVYTRRSGKEPVRAHIQAVLGDTMGEMFFYYAACDVVIMGGSFANLGGQNPIEPMAVGRPVIFGQHTFNFEQVCADAQAGHAGLRADNAAHALKLAFELLDNEQERQQLSRAALNQVAQHQGAVQRMLFYISGLVG